MRLSQISSDDNELIEWLSQLNKNLPDDLFEKFAVIENALIVAKKRASNNVDTTNKRGNESDAS